MKKSKLTFLFFLIFCSYLNVPAQSENEPLALLKYDKKSNLTKIFWLDKNSDWTCKKSIENLTLIKILYDEEDEVNQIYGLIFSDKKGRREQFVFSLNFTEYSNVDSQNIRSFIAQKQNYKVSSYRCGAGGNSDPEIFSIEKVIKRK